METDKYMLMLGKEGELKVAKLFIKDRELAAKLKTPMLFTYNGRLWIKTSGGRAVTYEQIKRLFPEVHEKVMEYFEQ